MRLLKWDNGDVCLVDAPERIPPYAILSHTWGPKNTEVTFEDVVNKAGKSKAGYEKIRFCGEQAQRDGLEYFWIDTCCIDKSNSTELIESLNSMFNWYKDSEVCYVYLSDVSENQSQPGWELSFRKCKWFTRGWTLQELLAPTKIKFFSSKSEYLGDKEHLGQLIHDITKIPIEALHGSCPLSKFSTNDRCAWMNGRHTTRPEDQAYALLGIVDAYLPFMYGYGRDKAMSELHKAMYEREKENTSIVQADEYLSSHHYSDERLRIQRLSGEKLYMAQCYINLAVVRQMSEKNTGPSDNETSPFNIFHRLNVDKTGADNYVDLSKMFDSRHTSQSLMKAPRRILIRGRAGVGKTTLCKKIVFEFERGNLWSDLFERVLWVPLRTLKTWSRDSPTLVNFFHYHYFRDDHRFGHVLAERLGAEVQLGTELGTRSKTLFILDGLDEVTEAWNNDEPMHDLLAKMLNQPNVIITSRPHAQLPLDVDNPIHLELETVGFQPEQVDEYLAIAISTPNEIKEIQSFLKRFAIVHGLARIPIILDALCYIWGDNTGINPKLQTMTNFYKYVQQQLMIRDSVRLGKQKASVANNMGPLQLEDCFRDEVELLEKLAFTGMVNDVIEFEPETRHAILRAFKGENDRILPDQSIRNLSFLRTSDPHKKGADVNYHFLHLTFQEFFAASYFVCQWKSNSEDFVCYLDLKHGKGKKHEAILSFLAQHKYNPRYDIFWRFVAGLLDDEQNSEEAAKFFQAIEEYQSRDLLGPAHQRLVMRCLNEVSKELESRRDLERRLKAWLIFEIESTSSSYLASEMEFPDHVLCDILRQRILITNQPFRSAINSRASLSDSIQQELLAWENERPSMEEILRKVGSHIRKPEALEELLARLGDKNRDIQHAAIDSLIGRSGEPEVKQALLARLGDKNVLVRCSAIEVLAYQVGDTEVQRALQARLVDEEPTVRYYATLALGNQAGDPEVRRVILTGLGDEDSDVRWATGVALVDQTNEPEVQQALFTWLGDTESQNRCCAMRLLTNQAGEPKVQQALLTQLKDEDAGVRLNAVLALSLQAGEFEVQEALLARLSDEDADVRRHAASALSSQASESKVQKALIGRLNDEDKHIQSIAVETLLRYQDEPLQTFDAQDRMTIVRTLCKMSFSQPFCWQVGSGASSLYTPWGLMKTSIADTKWLSEIIESGRPAEYPVDDLQHVHSGYDSQYIQPSHDLQHVQPGSSSRLSSLKWIQKLFFRKGPRERD